MEATGGGLSSPSWARGVRCVVRPGPCPGDRGRAGVPGTALPRHSPTVSFCEGGVRNRRGNLDAPRLLPARGP